MADNVQIPATGVGDTTPIVATDKIGGVDYQRVKLTWGVDGVATDASASNPLPVVGGSNSGVDIGDVTINNASGASAVNIQDGGNTITVDNGGTFPVQESQVIADNGPFTDGTSKVWPVGFIFDETPGTTVSENDAAAARIDVKRAQVFVQEDANTRGQRSGVSYQGRTYSQVAADGVMVSGNVLLAPLRQPINVAANNTVLISGIANRRIRVLNGVLMALTAVTVQLKSANNSDVTGPLPLGATGGFQIPEAEIGNFETQIGQNLTISMSASVNVGGWLTYVYL